MIFNYRKLILILFVLFIRLPKIIASEKECKDAIIKKPESYPSVSSILLENKNTQFVHQHSPEILQEVLNLKGPNNTVVFDIDSTLLRIAPRNLQIIKDFAETPRFANKYKRETSFLLSLETQLGTHQEIMGSFSDIEKVFNFLGLSQTHPDFYLEFRPFLKTNSLSNKYLHHDIPYEGVVDFLNKIYNNGVRIIYLTGRDRLRMGEGTLLSLRRHKFPLDGSQAQLIMKPLRGSISGIETADFKESILKDIPKRNSVYFFDNEPININSVHHSLPHIRCVYFTSTHIIGTEEAVAGDIPRIQSYQF